MRSKIAGRHVSREPEALLFCRRLDRSAQVRRYVMGSTRPHRHSRTCGSHEVVQVTPSAVRVKVYAGCGHQVVLVYPAAGTTPEQLAEALRGLR